jgi:hypothetical protein
MSSMCTGGPGTRRIWDDPVPPENLRLGVTGGWRFANKANYKWKTPGARRGFLSISEKGWLPSHGAVLEAPAYAQDNLSCSTKDNP